jgi:hypothetical protein
VWQWQSMAAVPTERRSKDDMLTARVSSIKGTGVSSVLGILDKIGQHTMSGQESFGSGALTFLETLRKKTGMLEIAGRAKNGEEPPGSINQLPISPTFTHLPRVPCLPNCQKPFFHLG